MRPLILLIIVLCMVPSAAAAPQVDVVLESLELEGSVAGNATLLGIAALDPSAFALGGASLTAASVDYLFETVERDVVVRDVVSARSDEDVETSSGLWRNATLNITTMRPEGYVVVVAADATASWTGTSLRIAPGAGSIKEPGKGAPDTQPALQASSDTAAHLAGAVSTLRIEGDFTVGVWGAEAILRHDGGTAGITTGYHDGTTGQLVDVVDQTWLYLSVEDGTLSFAAKHLPEATIYLQGAGTVSVAGLAEGKATGGRFLGTAIDAPTPVWATGTLDISWQGLPSLALRVRMTGDFTDAAAAGRAVALPDDRASWPVLWLALPLLAAAASAWWWRRRTDPLERLLAAGRWETAARKARSRLGGPSDTKARLALAVAMLRLSRPQEALDAVAQGQIHPGTRSLLQAQAYVMLGQEALARRLVAQCLRDAPQLRQQVRQNPVLERLASGQGAGYA